MMLLGSLLFAALYSAITDLLIRSRFEQLLGRERVPTDGHVVVAGLGNLGYRVMEDLLRSGIPAVAIERDVDGEFVAALRRQRPAVIGDARLPDTLVRAGLPGATCLVAATGDDAANLAISLAARELNPDLRTIVRLFDADLAQKVRGTLGFAAVMSASLLAAPAFVGAALHEGALHAFEAGGSLVVLVRGSAGEVERWRESTSKDEIRILLGRQSPIDEFTVAHGQLAAPSEDVVAAVWHPLVD
jgi:Trk K+ transport system NAD-binding subunit